MAAKALGTTSSFCYVLRQEARRQPDRQERVLSSAPLLSSGKEISFPVVSQIISHDVSLAR